MARRALASLLVASGFVLASATCGILLGACAPNADSLEGEPGENDLRDLEMDEEGDPDDHEILEAEGASSVDSIPEDPAASTPADGGVPGARAPSPVPGKVVTYAFGVKNDRYKAGYHTGEDYAAATGLDIVAVRNGKIVWSNDNGGAYGSWMGLEADNGRTYVYCHLSKRLYSVGEVVTAGQTIGKVGATGNVTGPHLHFEDHPAGPFVYAQVRKPQW